MGEEKKIPEIITTIVEFFSFWRNPNNIKDDYLPIELFQLRIYDVSMGFIFKWIVSEEEVRLVSEYTGIEIDENNPRRIGFRVGGEYNVELEYEEKPLI